MALRAVLEHPKFHRLASKLGASRFATLGALETMWHFTGRFAPQGNIGKYTDDEIEAWVGWDGVPGALIAALVECRWIDTDSTHRLVVHDWHSHADNATKLALKRSGHSFVVAASQVQTDAFVSTVSPQCCDSVADIATPLRLPVPVPVPGAEPGAGAVRETTKRFTTPSVSDLATYFGEIGLTEDPQRFLDYYQSKGWKVGTTPMKDWRAAARTWLQRRKAEQTQTVKPKRAPLTAEELEMIQR